MTKARPDILILVGSPNEDGRSAKLAGAFMGAFNTHGINPCLYELAKYPVAACNGCGLCMSTGECRITGDGFNVLSRHMDSCDAMLVIAPVYFAGPSGWLKAALDRCQVYWARRYALGQEMPSKRPAYLAVVGEGGDPFGYGPLVTICTSALNSTGLRVDAQNTVFDFAGENYDMARVPVLVDEILRKFDDGLECIQRNAAFDLPQAGENEM